MSAPTSEERISALVDGELARAEAEELLEAMGRDAGLRDRVCQVKLGKELLRHAYAGVQPRRDGQAAGGSASRWRAAASLLLFAGGIAAGWVANETWNRADATGQIATHGAPAYQGATDHVILHLSSGSLEHARAVLDRAEGILEAARGSDRQVSVELVANGAGLDLLRVATSPHAERIAALRAAHPGLALVACGQTLQRLRESGADTRLLPGAITATSALDEIVHRLQQGWAYVRI